MNDRKTIYGITSLIPKGKVLTYAMVGEIAGVKNPRIVGNILHKNPGPEKIPCHRVVNSQGKVAAKFAFGGAKGQVEKLLNEGVKVQNGKIDLNKFLWITQILSS